MSLKEKIKELTISHITNQYGHNLVYANEILSAVKILLADNITSYQFPFSLTDRDIEADKVNYQTALSKVNEKESRRKKEGVYYTDRDVTDFMAANTLLHFAYPNEKQVYGFEDVEQKLNNLPAEKKMELIRSSVIDPTCGSGEFLISILSLKITLYCSLKINQSTILFNNIFGNDIEHQSTDITKLRLFFLLVESIKISNIVELAKALYNNFTNEDAINCDVSIFGKKDIYIGNPPYVEYRNFNYNKPLNYGNIYADVLHHSVNNLNDNGIMAFVVPLSYVSTIRMGKIRTHIMEKTDKQIVINFADRPDCLFSSVHQKLSIVIAQKNTEFKGVLSSSYNYWYHSEREHLFNNISLIPTFLDNAAYWPKIGNEIELSIYEKFLNLKGTNMLDMPKTNETVCISVNQRGCFWMKVFLKDMESNSYAKYAIPKQYVPFIYCLLNSSLFFLLWVIISDGWHITNKELGFVKLPSSIPCSEIWNELMHKLATRLEETKVFVNTKQVDYEYKHKECKSIIDRIDDEISTVYQLTTTQLDYIKNFAIKYRVSNGA